MFPITSNRRTELAAAGGKCGAGELTAQARAYATMQGVKLVEGVELAKLVRG